MSGYLYPSKESLKRQRILAHKDSLKNNPRYARLFFAMQKQKLDGDRLKRYREIWTCVLEARKIEKLPHRLRIAATPRIRGIGHAAARAGF